MGCSGFDLDYGLDGCDFNAETVGDFAIVVVRESRDGVGGRFGFLNF